MAFTGNERHDVTLEDAQRLIRNYRRGAGANDHRAGFFGRAAIERLLAQPGCVGIRAYSARQDNGQPTLVLVGVNANEQDITATIIEDHIPCPPNCDPGSALHV